MASGIALAEVAKVYRSDDTAEMVALAPTSLEIRDREFFSLVGPSGCGKTTLLNLVAGLVAPTEGLASVGGKPVVGPDHGVGIVFQRPTLLRWRTVLDNVLLPATIAKSATSEVKQRAQDLLRLTGIHEYRDRYPNELSGGMQQRAAIARALALDPDVLLMDEPFSALDEFTRESLNDELMKIWTERPKTVVFITHNIAEAVYLSDRVGVMRAKPGRLAAVIDIALDRPRVASTRTDPRFFEYQTRIRELMAEAEGTATDRSKGSGGL